MSKARTCFAFLDTNIFLQFTEFTQIDWCTLLGCETVCLVLTSVNLDELDRHKYDARSQRRQKRARNTLEKIGSIIQDPPDAMHSIPHRPGVFLKLLLDHPRASSPSLSGNDNDHQMIAAIVDFAAQISPQDQSTVVFVADDTRARFKAMTLSIETLELPESYRLPPEPDQATRRVQELERKLATQSSRMPKPLLDVIGSDENGLVQVKQSMRNTELSTAIEALLEEPRTIVHRVEAAYRKSPRTRPRVNPSLFGATIQTVGQWDLHVRDAVKHRIITFLGSVDTEVPMAWLSPVDVHTKAPPIHLVRADANGIDAAWYNSVLALDDACNRASVSVFQSWGDATHFKLQLRLRNDGTDGLRGVSVDVLSEAKNLSLMLPNFRRPKSPRELVAPIFAPLASDERGQAYEVSDRLESQLERLRPTEEVRVEPGFVVVPETTGRLSLRVLLRADNLSEPIERDFVLDFDSGAPALGDTVAEWRRSYGDE